MKFSASAFVAVCLSASTDAFTSPSAGRASAPRFSTVEQAEPAAEPAAEEASPSRENLEKLMEQEAVKEEEPEVEAWKLDPLKRVQAGRYDDLEKSIALPFLKRPSKLDGTHAGDFGFDPLGLTETYDLYTMQESELRHGRLAMLAVIGWPLSELLAPDFMLQKGMAPSVLNGFNPFSLAATVAIFGGLGFFEYKTALRRTSDTKLGRQHREDMGNIWDLGVAGDYNFDPLGLYSSIGNDASARKGLREVEISHGRSAMLGITGFALWEYLTGHPIVENSMFFHPNLLLPSLVAAGVAAGSIYEFSDSEEYPLQIQVSSEGQARLDNAKMSLNNLQSKISEVSGDGDDNDTMDKALDFLDGLKSKYENLSEGYTEWTMKNYK